MTADTRLCDSANVEKWVEDVLRPLCKDGELDRAVKVATKDEQQAGDIYINCYQLLVAMIQGKPGSVDVHTQEDKPSFLFVANPGDPQTFLEIRCDPHPVKLTVYVD
ncbi:MAG: hypothetical protein PHS53_05200 [Candidatus Pacebacteria bacterium]|nr:hypothetical protein [Candidatus Paceibacterota bacterium]MDD5357506.1 hypothetical protein [Candidatus Paceibacterota bacterium]